MTSASVLEIKRRKIESFKKRLNKEADMICWNHVFDAGWQEPSLTMISFEIVMENTSFKTIMDSRENRYFDVTNYRTACLGRGNRSGVDRNSGLMSGNRIQCPAARGNYEPLSLWKN